MDRRDPDRSLLRFARLKLASKTLTSRRPIDRGEIAKIVRRAMQTPDRIPVIEDQLGPQERLLWAGRPPAGLVLRPAEVFLIPFSLLWCGFAIFWEWGAVTMANDPFFALFGIPFVLMGLYIVFGRFVLDRKQREYTFYGLTNERVLIVSGIVRRTVKSLNLRTLSDVSRTERADGSGTITFGQSSFFLWSFQSAAWPGITTVPTFERIANVKDVYDLLRTAQRAAA